MNERLNHEIFDDDVYLFGPFEKKRPKIPDGMFKDKDLDKIKVISKKLSNESLLNELKRIQPPTTIDYETYPIMVERAIGSVIWDVEEKEYLDLTSQIGVLNLGHCHPKINEAVAKQMNKLNFAIATDWPHFPLLLWEKTLKAIMPLDFEIMVWPEITGAGANNAAVEIIKTLSSQEANIYLKKNRGSRMVWLAFEGAFHGRQGYAKDLTQEKPIQKTQHNDNLKVIHLPFPDDREWRDGINIESGKTYIEEIQSCPHRYCFRPQDVQGFFMELVQGQAGVNVSDKKSIEQIFDYCRANDIVTIVDEIQTGFGRTGKLFAFEHYGIQPDVITLAKSLGGGLPLGAVVFRKDLFHGFDQEIMSPGKHSGTFNATPLACISSIAFINALYKKTEAEKIINAPKNKSQNLEYELPACENFIGRAQKLGEFMINWFLELDRQLPYLQDFRGIGLMWGIDIIDEDGKPSSLLRNKIIHQCVKNGLLVSQSGVNTIRFLPSLNIFLGQLEVGLERFAASVNEVVEK